MAQKVKTADRKDPIIWQTRLKFFLSLAFLVFFTCGQFFILRHQLHRAETDAAVIGYMENQYSLIQKTTFFAASYSQSIDVVERKILRENVHDALKLILVFEPFSTQESLKATLSSELTKKIRGIYFNHEGLLNKEVGYYIANVKSFLMASPIRLSSDNPLLTSLQTRSMKLLESVRGEVAEYQTKNQKHLMWLRTMGLLLFLLSLSCLIAISILVFRPAVKSIENYLFQLKNVNFSLEERVAERTLALEEKALELTRINEQLRLEMQERLRIDTELKRTQAQQEALLDNLPDLAWLKDQHSNFIAVNGPFAKACGFKTEELCGKNDLDIWPRELAEQYRADDQEVMRSRKQKRVEELLADKEKGWVWIETIKMPIYNEKGEVTGTVGIARDITERKKAEEQLREMSLAMENALDGIARFDANMKYLSVNKSYAAMMGYSPEELIGLNRILTVCAEDHGKIKVAFEEMKKNGKAEFEVKAIRKDGTIFYQYGVVVKAYDKDQEFTGFYCFAKDITERKYREALEIKSELISMVSHELRTPIHSVKEGISIVLEGLTGEINPEQKDVLTISKRCIDRLARLINDVLVFHRMDAGVIEFKMEKESINALIQEVAETSQALIKDKGLSLKLNLGGNLPKVKMDRDKIIQVVTNFIQNAVKFASTGDILITSSLAPPFIKVSVSDKGIGIKQEDISKLFRKFGQLETAKAVAPGGAGLGLAISKKIIEQHHGQIGVESEYGHGSTFYFTLPLE